MKKTLIVLLTAVLAMSMLFVSCSNETKLDERVNVSFGVSQGRSLSSSASFAEFDGLYWWYKAETNSTTDFNYGKTDGWTKLSNGLDTTLELSQGIWNFELCAVASDTDSISDNQENEDDNTQKIYYGKRTGVLVEKTNNGNPVTIAISVTPGSTGQGTIIISNQIVINKKNSNGTFSPVSSVKATHYQIFTVDAAGNERVVTETPEPVEIENNNSQQLGSGQYRVKVWYKEDLGNESYIIRACEPIDVTVYDSSTITVQGSIDESTQAIIINPVNKYKVEGSTTVTKTGVEFQDIAVTAPMTPAMSSSASDNTVVTVPGSIISAKAGEEATSATVKVAVEVTPVTEASVNDAFKISSTNNTAAAAIDLTLYVNGSAVTEYSEAENAPLLTVETYVAKNLSDVKVSFNGKTKDDGDSGIIDVYYDSATGYLRFTTKHFSTFVVETSSEAMIGDTAYDTLQNAIYALTSGDTVVLLKDVELDSSITIKDGKELTINLHGNDVSCSDKPFIIYNAKVNFVGEGTIYETDDDNHGAIQVKGSSSDIANYTVVSIGKDVTLRGWSGIYIAKDVSDGYNNYGIVINLEGKAINPGMSNHTTAGFGVYINGSNKKTSGNVPVININGAHIESLGSGIYAAGYAKWNIKGDASISGKETAIEIRAGELTIDGGTFTATNTPSSSSGNGNGTTTEGAAIAIAQHTTTLPINVTINGGTFEGYSAFYESNPQNNSADDIAKVNLAITGGTFNAINGGTCAVYSQDKVGFITGGTFSTDPSDYVPFGYDVVETADGYVVSTSTELTVNNADQLMKFAASVNAGNDYAGKTITLGNDIDLIGITWVPIGEGNRADRQHVFKGTFEGNNHTIKNLSSIGYDPSTVAVYYNGDMLYAYGLFGIVEGATIQNVKFENISIDTAITVNDTTYKGDSVGAVVGYAFKNATITGCEVSSGSIKGHDAVAGIVGRAYGENAESDKFEISNCKNYATIQATKGKVAGVIGITGYLDNSRYSSIIQNCENRGTITGNEAGTAGIIAYVNKNTTINSCHNYGVIGSSNDQYSGGIGGYVTGSNIEFVDCNNYATGTITASLDAGGIVGISTNISNIKNCENSGSICAGDNGHAGGIAGSTKFSNVTDCKNTATVHGMYSGGIIGVDAASTITNCSGGTADIKSPAHVIGFTGHRFTLSVEENKSSGRLIGGLGGAGQNAFTKLSISANESDENLPAVGICGIYTTWSNLEVIGGNFYGEPLAGNTSYIILTQAGSWGGRAAGTYTRGGVTESSRIAEWTKKNN